MCEHAMASSARITWRRKLAVGRAISFRQLSPEVAFGFGGDRERGKDEHVTALARKGTETADHRHNPSPSTSNHETRTGSCRCPLSFAHRRPFHLVPLERAGPAVSSVRKRGSLGRANAGDRRQALADETQQGRLIVGTIVPAPVDEEGRCPRNTAHVGAERSGT